MTSALPEEAIALTAYALRMMSNSKNHLTSCSWFWTVWTSNLKVHGPKHVNKKAPQHRNYETVVIYKQIIPPRYFPEIVRFRVTFMTFNQTVNYSLSWIYVLHLVAFLTCSFGVFWGVFPNNPITFVDFREDNTSQIALRSRPYAEDGMWLRHCFCSLLNFYFKLDCAATRELQTKKLLIRKHYSPGILYCDLPIN